MQVGGDSKQFMWERGRGCTLEDKRAGKHMVKGRQLRERSIRSRERSTRSPEWCHAGVGMGSKGPKGGVSKCDTCMAESAEERGLKARENERLENNVGEMGGGCALGR